MKNTGTRFVLFLNYFVFAVLLNTVGAVILQVQQSFGATKSSAALLEGFKDLPIAIGTAQRQNFGIMIFDTASK